MKSCLMTYHETRFYRCLRSDFNSAPTHILLVLCTTLMVNGKNSFTSANFVVPPSILLRFSGREISQIIGLKNKIALI